MRRHPLRIGHRGAAGHAPENTVLSIETAIALGVDLVETDVQRTADGRLVVLHDKRVDRTTSGQGYVAEMTIEQVRGLKMESGAGIPTLEEVLDTVSGRAGIIIELIAEGISRQVIDCVRSSGFAGEVIYASFLHAEVVAIREQDASAQTLALLEGIPVERTSFARAAGVSHVGLGFDSVRESFVRELQYDGLKVFTYTLDAEADIEKAIDWGVDGIISNYPERVPK